MTHQLVFTAYNRHFYLEPTVQSWNTVRGLNLWPATFFIEPSEVSEQMVDIALRLNTQVTTIVHEHKQGVLVNPWLALNSAFESGAEFVVIAEDDIAVSDDILEYFQWASQEYQTAKNVLAVCAYSALGGPRANEVMQTRKFSPLVWGIWRNRWTEHLRDTWDKDYSSGNTDGSEAGWDWNINRILTEKQLNIIQPLQSRSDHLGEHLGTHMTPELYPSSRGKDFEQFRGRSRYIEI